CAFLGTPAAEVPWVALDHGPPDVVLSRLDAFLTPDGPRFIEINSDAPAGFGYSDRMARVHRDLPVFREFARTQAVTYQASDGGPRLPAGRPLRARRPRAGGAGLPDRLPRAAVPVREHPALPPLRGQGLLRRPDRRGIRLAHERGRTPVRRAGGALDAQGGGAPNRQGRARRRPRALRPCGARAAGPEAGPRLRRPLGLRGRRDPGHGVGSRSSRRPRLALGGAGAGRHPRGALP